MSARTPAAHLVERMSEGGGLAVITNILCLGAATAIKFGTPIEEVRIEEAVGALGPEPLPPDAIESLRDAMRKVHAQLLAVTPTELDEAIALYTAALKRLGFTVAMGSGADS